MSEFYTITITVQCSVIVYERILHHYTPLQYSTMQCHSVWANFTPLQYSTMQRHSVWANFTPLQYSAMQCHSVWANFTPLQYSAMQRHSVCDLWIVDSEAALLFLRYHVECLPYFSIYMLFSQHVKLHHSIYEHCDSLGFNSAFHPSRVGKWVPALAGKAKAGMVHSVSGWTRVCRWNCEIRWETRAIPERLGGVITTRRYTNPRLP